MNERSDVRSLLYSSFIALALGLSVSACATCPPAKVAAITGDHSLSQNLSYETDPNRIVYLRAQGAKTHLDWGRFIRTAEKKHLARTGEKIKLNATILMDGEEKTFVLKGRPTKILPDDVTSIDIDEREGVQTAYFIILKRADGTVYDVSDLALKQSTRFIQRVDYDSAVQIVRDRLFDISNSDAVSQLGIDPEMVSTAVKLGYSNLVWVLTPFADKSIRDLIYKMGDRVGIRYKTGLSGKIREFTIYDVKTGRIVKNGVDPKNFFVKVDAAFNGNSFFWDDMLVSLATVPFDPKLAISTMNTWLEAQEPDGAMMREMMKVNLKSLWPKEIVHDGGKPMANLVYTNPFLMHWVADTLFDFNPTRHNLVFLKRVADSVERYTKWLEENRMVRDPKLINPNDPFSGFIGFNTSALATGADDSSGERGNNSSPGAHNVAWLPMLVQQISMYKSMAKTYETVGEHDKAREKLERVAFFERQLQQHWDPVHRFFFDLIPDGHGGWKRDTRYFTIQGMLPLWSGSATPEQVEILAKEWLTDDRFGGRFPLPANARFAVDDGNPGQDGYWRKWGHWPSMAAMVIEGFRQSGRPDVAFELATGFLRGMTDFYTEYKSKNGHGTVAEYYGEFKGPDGQIYGRLGINGDHETRIDFAGWGKLPPIYNMFFHVLGILPQREGFIDWNLMIPLKQGQSISAVNFVYNEKLVSELKITRVDESNYELTVKSAQPFRIKINSYRDASGALQRAPVAGAEEITVGGGNTEMKYRVNLSQGYSKAG